MGTHARVFNQTLGVGTARIKKDNETDDDVKTRGVSEYGKKVKRARKKNTDGLSVPSQNKILINTWYYVTRYVKGTMKFN